MASTSPMVPEGEGGESSGSARELEQGIAPPQQAQPNLREQAWWMLLGLGCTWFLGDAINLQTSWWIDSQPEGDRIGALIALASSFAPLSVVPCVLLRTFFPRCYKSLIAPAMIALSLICGYILGAGLWSMSSIFIYVSVFISQSVGAMVPFGVVPWILTEGFNTALISSMYFGGGLGSLSASVLCLIQQPGSAKRFSPTIFFLTITTPILGSAFACHRIHRKGIGAVVSSTTNDRELHLRSQGFFCSIKHWWLWALCFALMASIMATGSFPILRAALPYAATNTVIGHSICSPLCADTCGRLPTTDLCGAMSACEWSAGHCIENKGADYLQWAQSLAQWTYAAGTGFTVLLPTMRIWIFPLIWLFPFGAICSMAFGRAGTWEFDSAGWVLVALVCLVRFCQGYFEVMQWRYLAYKYGAEAEAATLFVGTVSLGLSLISGVASSSLVAALSPH